MNDSVEKAGDVPSLLKVCLVEYDLLWSVRLKKSFVALGHVVTVSETGLLTEPVDLAIVNLSAKQYNPTAVISKLKSEGIKVIAHAGHKEASLLNIGKDSGADYVATNGELALNPARAISQVFMNQAKK